MFDGLLGGRLGCWLLERVARPPVESHSLQVPDVPSCFRKLGEHFGSTFRTSLCGKTVLDYGCGRGEAVVAAAKLGADMVIGLDIRQSVLDQGRELAEREKVKEKCFFLNATKAGACDQYHDRIDTVLSLDAFEHYRFPERELYQMRELLRPGGTLFISFGPPWWHPYGCHMMFMGAPPWAHLMFSEKAIMTLRTRYRSDGAKRFEDVEGGLNRMTIRRFEKSIESSGLQVHALDLIPIRHTGMLRRTWFGRECLTSVVRAHLSKG
jgi:SAM-dependent methyltransferase